MIFAFEEDMAKKYGVPEAVFIHCIQFWIAKNKASNKHFYDGSYWMYNSCCAFQKLLPFWSQKQIERLLNKLVNLKVIKKGNYNKNPYDRTLWYAFVDEEKFVPMDSTELENTFPEIGEPIPDSNTISNKEEIKESNKEKKEESVQTGLSSADSPSESPVLDLPPVFPLKGECQSPEDFDSRNQGKNFSDQPKDISETNPDKFFPGSSGSKDDEQIPSIESLRSSKNKESSQSQKFLRGESNTNIVQLTNEESVNDRVFEDLWQAYVPYVTQDGRSTNKGSKKLAKEKFMKTISKGANPYDVLRGTRRYIEDCHNRKTLTKNVITFLNQEQWRDYLVACNIKNNHPLKLSELTPFNSKEEFMGFFSQETYKPFINDNPSFFETIQSIRAGLTNGNIEKSILMAQELANEVWEYKDTTQIKNSILDPNLWALCRFEIDPRESKSAIMIVGYFLRRLWLEEKRRLVENKF